ncbi:MAG: purine-nucleoside phosphorylase [Nanoarchaeota archaeon]|nr:purine-nucleoside phosphorylase [Nanoarchaeota archaeon]
MGYSTQKALEELTKAYSYQKNYEQKVKEAAIIIKQSFGHIRRGIWTPPEFGIVLGSGLGDLANEIEDAKTIKYEHIPNFPRTTVEGHEGKLIYGKIGDVPVIGLKGRKHYYEVADEPFNTGMLQIMFPVHVLAELGVKNYFATDTARGLNERYYVGDIMVLEDHVNHIPNALLGRQHDFKRVGGEPTLRHQPMNDAYDKDLTRMLFNTGGHDAIYRCHSFGGFMRIGTYLAVTGLTYETKAECIEFRNGLGADAVGMSVTPEIIAAKNRGMKCVAMSCITNKILKDGTNATSNEEAKEILESETVKNNLTSTIRKFFTSYRGWDKNNV